MKFAAVGRPLPETSLSSVMEEVICTAMARKRALKRETKAEPRLDSTTTRDTTPAVAGEETRVWGQVLSNGNNSDN